MSAADDFTRVYTEGGTVVHLLDFNKSPNSRDDALCGRSPWPGLWNGTGNQEEHEKAETLRLCVSCASVLRFRMGGV